MKAYIFGLFLFVFAPFSYVHAQATTQDMNEANSPLTPKLGLNLQNYYTGSFYGLDDSDANSMLLRGIVPHKTFDLPQIARITMPINTTPDEPFGSTTGIGDINIFDVFLTQALGVELGVGPQLTIPSATSDALGTEKWQGGLATTVIAPQDWGLLGGLVTWQHSFAGSDDRDTQNGMQAQPFIIYNLPDSYFVRSTAIWNFNVDTGDYVIPVGLGSGKVWKTEDGTTINFFLEPQWALFHEGVQPQFQLFAGLNFQFPIGH